MGKERRMNSPKKIGFPKKEYGLMMPKASWEKARMQETRTVIPRKCKNPPNFIFASDGKKNAAPETKAAR